MKHGNGIVGWVAVVLAVGTQSGVGQDVIRPDLGAVEAGSGWGLSNRSAATWREGARVGTTLDARAGHGIAWLEGTDFEEGTIEVALRGSDTPGRSFVGIAFRGVDHDTFDAIYLRPFNFRAEAAASRAHSVQYVSHPEHTWARLREESPDRYEAALDPAPDPSDFVRVRIVLEADRVSVFVEGAARPALEVTGLSNRGGGLVGLWVGNNSDGTFADLVLRPAAIR